MNKEFDKALEALEHIKKAPDFMGGDERYLGALGSNVIYKEDCKLVENDLKLLEELMNSLICVQQRHEWRIGEELTLKEYVDQFSFVISKMLDEKARDALSDWIINNINKEKVREWLNEDANNKCGWKNRYVVRYEDTTCAEEKLTLTDNLTQYYEKQEKGEIVIMDIYERTLVC